jgi:hypothetical protein
MPGEVRVEPVAALTDAPTADENHAIGSGLARFNEQQSVDLFFLPDNLRGHGLARRPTSTSATATRSSASFRACHRGPAASS